MNIELLEKLCTACGISGDEGEVRRLILNEIKSYATEITKDAMGNLLVFKKGENRANKKLLISAHMDEVGFIVNEITEKGLIKFSEVGGVDRRVIMGKAVTVGKEKLPGAVCAKPIHLLESGSRNTIPLVGEMYIDIGAKNRENALEYVQLGDSISFAAPFTENNYTLMGKALDDRAGCLVMIELIKSDLLYDTWFSFVVQEEIGLRGAKCAAFTIDPEFAIVVESTTAADIPEVPSVKQVCRVHEGAVVSFMDKRTIYDKALIKLAFLSAEQAGVNIQLKKAVAGGNDAGAIHQSRSGVRTAAVSLPCRYLHSACGLISKEDLHSVYKTVEIMAQEISAGNVQ